MFPGMNIMPASMGSPLTGYGQPSMFATPMGTPLALGGGTFFDPFPPSGSNDPYGSGMFSSFTPVPATPAAAAAAASAMMSLGATDEIRTIFISGFPNDVKERELNNMLRYLPGYEASQINWKTGQPQGFALFSSAMAARTAVDLLTGVQFDDGVLLRAEIAHKNMFLKQDDPSVKRSNRPTPLTMAPMGMAAQMPPAGAPPPQYLAAMLPGSPATLMPMPLRPQAFSPVTNLRDNPPCNTLFIGNLGDNASEAELRSLFVLQPGYRQLKLVRGPKSTTAFVEFADVGSAIMVHQTLQGAVLQTSDRGGIRIQFSKNPFGRREGSESGISIGGSMVGGVMPLPPPPITPTAGA